jgi:hypothetical protein
MDILISILFIVLIFGSSGAHLYFVLKNKDKKTFLAQLTILLIAALGGVLAIYNLTDPSLSKMLNNISPL